MGAYLPVLDEIGLGEEQDEREARKTALEFLRETLDNLEKSVVASRAADV